MRNEVIKTLNSIGIEISANQAVKFEKYYELLIEWNEKINLTRITEKSDVALKHFADSLTLLNYCEVPEGAKVIDVGTGAGFPGIPLKIMRPDIKLTLLDSLNKRLNFLSEVCEQIGIEAELVHARAEDGGRDNKHREKYDVAVSRAVARLNVLSEYCLPYVKVGGVFAAMKGPDLREEFSQAEEAIETLGGQLISLDEFELENAGERTIVVIEKTAHTPKQFPRQSGKIKSKPL